MIGLVVTIDAWVIWPPALLFALAKTVEYVMDRRRADNIWRDAWSEECDAHHRTRLEAIHRNNVVHTAVAWRGDPEEYTNELIEAVDALTATEQEVER